MDAALAAARLADFATSPNPMVGCVVARGGEVIATGYHRRAGGPHAEVEALAVAGDRARGADVYMTLEPCAHQGRTPPCVDALIAAAPRRVVIAMSDPNPRVAGRGADALRHAGIVVEMGVHEAESQRLNEFYVKHRLTGRPFVSTKFAMSLDGKIATRAGESRWITGEDSRRHGHRLRHIHDAILVGVGTVIADDPALTARLEGEDARQPLRVVLDSQLRTQQSAKVVGPNTLIASTRSGSIGTAEILVLPAADDGRVRLAPLLDELGRRGILSLLVEGGSEVHGSFFAEGLVDKVLAYMAPRLIGGRDAPGAIGGRGIERLVETVQLRELDTTRLGADILITGYVDVHRDR